MSHSQNDTPREQVIQPPPGKHEAPMPENPVGTDQARQGETSGRVRWVLGAGVVLVVIAFVLAFVFSV
ncbi:hypothetical protein [Teichococcus vastitatis]|jgi:hypothetical protein|uniref:Uncharacterized protein n=1 Tax=Teichococcus vastitatis TaxID=2307076 RepID=A0ABS9W451_9PROT|nr:hypothetical protein [Pseudoroseomonas vastitatis]MCI0754055.1 hypothetical protein [Pseudoroseomonas vastitatis]